MKKILISGLVFDDGKSGIAEYLISICRELSKANQVDLLMHQSDSEIFPVKNENIRIKLIPDYLQTPFLSMLWHLFILPYTVNTKNYDVFLLPAGNRRLLSYYPRNCIVTFHDLAQYYIPDKYDKIRMFYVKNIIPHYLRNAPVIMAISENTKNDLIKHYILEPNRIEVNYNGYNPERLQTDLSEKEFRETYQIKNPYIFYNSRIEHPIKNHLQLIRAFELLPEEIREKYDLVFSGVEGHGNDIIHEYLSQSQITNRVKFFDYVDHPIIGAFYKYADLYVFPSLYEGFGIPLLEAMASGVPVICSNLSALPEIGGDAILTFDPNMHADIAQKILAVITNQELRQRMIQKGLNRAKQFSWQRHIETMLSLIGKESAVLKNS